jgi:hypothetical protein
MARNDETSALIDGILRFTVTSGTLAAGIIMPNLLIALEKPLNRYYKHLDRRARERELRRILGYMRSQRLISDTYEHGLTITEKGRKRLSKAEFDRIEVQPLQRWDKQWRLVFYDIPEKHKVGRNALTAKLRELGFYQLQRSVWVHPFPCREVIKEVTVRFEISRYTSLVEAPFIDSQQKLIQRFQKHYPNTNFK